MDRKSKIRLIGAAAGFVLALAWVVLIFVLIAETEFSTRDIIALVCLLAAEVLTIKIALLLLYKGLGITKEQVKAEIEAEKEAPKTALEKRSKRCGTLLIIAAGVLAFGFETCGIFLEAQMASVPPGTLVAVTIVCLALPVVLGIASLPLTKRYFAKLGDMQVAEQ